MGNPRWSCNEMIREADRIITESKKVDKDTPIGDLELRLKSHDHDNEFYFNCGVAAANVSNDIFENGGCDDLNAAIGGLAMFRDLIRLDDSKKEKVKRRRILYDFNKKPYAIKGDCPRCGEQELISISEQYCPKCGQKLDWSEDEENGYKENN